MQKLLCRIRAELAARDLRRGALAPLLGSDDALEVVVQLEGAPDAKSDPDAYRAYLAKARIAGAFSVTVEITDAAEVATPIEDKPGAQRLETRLALRMLGTPCVNSWRRCSFCAASWRSKHPSAFDSTATTAAGWGRYSNSRCLSLES